MIPTTWGREDSGNQNFQLAAGQTSDAAGRGQLKVKYGGAWPHLIVQVDVRELDQILELGSLTQHHHQLSETVQLPVSGVFADVR